MKPSFQMGNKNRSEDNKNSIIQNAILACFGLAIIDSIKLGIYINNNGITNDAYKLGFVIIAMIICGLAALKQPKIFLNIAIFFSILVFAYAFYLNEKIIARPHIIRIGLILVIMKGIEHTFKKSNQTL